MLRTQYRCHPVISDLANSLFYQGQLLDGIQGADREPVLVKTHHIPVYLHADKTPQFYTFVAADNTLQHCVICCFRLCTSTSLS